MRTKTLLMAGAALAFSLATSQAQVYSANVVGYVNVSVPAGYSMVANQLDFDGTGTNNSIATVLGNSLPNNFTVEAWNGASFTSTKWSAGAQKWNLNNLVISNAMQMGSGFFVNSPVATNFTEIGTVIQGTNSYPIVSGYQVVSANTPQAGLIKTYFGYNPTKNDTVEVWNGASFSSHKWGGSSWTGGGEPNLSISQAVFLDAVAPNTWTQGFIVP